MVFSGADDSAAEEEYLVDTSPSADDSFVELGQGEDDDEDDDDEDWEVEAEAAAAAESEDHMESDEEEFSFTTAGFAGGGEGANQVRAKRAIIPWRVASFFFLVFFSRWHEARNRVEVIFVCLFVSYGHFAPVVELVTPPTSRLTEIRVYESRHK